MDAKNLRQLLATALNYLLLLHTDSEGEIPILPFKEELEEARSNSSKGLPEIVSIDMEVFPNEMESFFPMVEMYMGKRRKELPLRLRTLEKHMMPVGALPKKNKKKKKRK